VSSVPDLFDGETFISYEDCESLGVKIAYLKEKGMGGIMFWEYKCDLRRLLLHPIFWNKTVRQGSASPLERLHLQKTEKACL